MPVHAPYARPPRFNHIRFAGACALAAALAVNSRLLDLNLQNNRRGAASKGRGLALRDTLSHHNLSLAPLTHATNPSSAVFAVRAAGRWPKHSS